MKRIASITLVLLLLITALLLMGMSGATAAPGKSQVTCKIHRPIVFVMRGWTEERGSYDVVMYAEEGSKVCTKTRTHKKAAKRSKGHYKASQRGRRG